VSGPTNPTFPAVCVPIVAYRGTRTYIHSTDLYIELMAAAGTIGLALGGPVDLRFKRAITTQVEIHFDGEVESPEAGAAPARFAIGGRNRVVFGRIVATDRPVTGRKTYDERRIWDIAQIDGHSVTLSGGAGYAPIEVVTALGVLLHNTALAPPPGSRWLLSRLSLDRPLRPTDAVEMKIAITHAIGRTMTRSSLAASDGAIGNMDFIVGTAPSASTGSA
jgi:hypothetical protein